MSCPPDDPLGQQHADARRDAARARRGFASSQLGAFANAMSAAMTEYHRMREAGVSREDACKGLEAVIRDAWPKPTTKYPPACSDCDGTGWREMVCWAEQRCGRRVCVDRHPSWEHRYVVSCHCLAGDRRRARPTMPEDALTAVGRMQTRKKTNRGFTRVGD